MRKIKKIISVLSVLLLLLTTLVVGPFPKTYAEDVENKREIYSALQVDKEVVLNEELLLKPGIIVYGIVNLKTNTAKVQYRDDLIEISMDHLIELEDLADMDIPEFRDLSMEEVSLTKFSKDHLIVDSSVENSSSAFFLQDVEYPTYSKFLLIGNVLFTPVLKKDNDEDLNNESNEQNIQTDKELSGENNKLKDEEGIGKSEENIENSSQDSISQDDEELLKTEIKKENVTTSSLQNKFTNSDKYFKALKDMAVYDNRDGALEQIGVIKKGQVYPRYESSPNWHRIQFGNFKAFVKKEGTEPASGNSIKNLNKTYTVTDKSIVAKQDLIVYDNTSGNLVPFGVINKGQEYHISYDYFGKWIYVAYADRIGFIDSTKIERKNYFAQFRDYFHAEENLPVYDNRNGSLVQVGELKKGQTYPRYEGSPNWHQIQFDNYRAYVHKKNTTPSSGTEIKNYNEDFKSQSRKVIANKDITVYDNSSGNLVPFGTIKAGQEYSIVKDYGGKWIYIIFSDRVGYIDSSEVKRDFISSDKYFKTIEDNVPVYDNRSGNLIEVGQLKKGQVYPRYESSEKWHKIQYGNFKAFVKKEFTEPSNGKAINNEMEIKYDKSLGKFKALKDLNVYDREMNTFATIKAGQEYPFTFDYGGSLIYIVFSDRVGFVKVNDIEIQSNIVTNKKETKYDLSLEEALKEQMKVNPQTSNDYKTYVSKSYINSKNEVTASTLNVRGGPGTSYWVVGQLNEGNKVTILNEVSGWYEIEYDKLFVNANRSDTLFYLDPLNFINDSKQRFQFLDLSRGSDVSTSVLNNFLEEKGTLSGQAQAFIHASQINGINDIYLISHAMLETGNGSSKLASGVKVGINSKGHAVMVTAKNKNSLTAIKTVYNMFGINANDGCAVKCGSERAYKEGWTTPYKAIVGGAKFIGNGYIKAGQNTLYKMRWNPDLLEQGYAGHQYATDIGWAYKQVDTMYNLYQQLDSYSLYLDIPVYK